MDVIQWGLGAFEHYLATGGETWLDAAVAVGRHLLRDQVQEGRQQGGWPHRRPYPHTFRLEPPWLSAMAQGEGASLLLRLGSETGDAGFTEAGTAALLPYSVPSGEGGVLAELEGGPFLEEYPTDPSSYVLNGGIFAMWGLYDAEIAVPGEGYGAQFERCVDVLAAAIGRWDTGHWTRYDLFPHVLPNVASPAYHTLHIDQVEALNRLSVRPELDAAAARWRAYRASRFGAGRATAAKVAFRLAVPRSRRLSALLPWSRA